jgi:hypothetical protein
MQEIKNTSSLTAINEAWQRNLPFKLNPVSTHLM